MKNVKAFFSWIASVPELWEEFLVVMQEISPAETEKMYEKLSQFAIGHGFDEAAAELLLFYQEELRSSLELTPEERERIPEEFFSDSVQ